MPWERRPHQAAQARARGEQLLDDARAAGEPVLALGRLVGAALGLPSGVPLCSWHRVQEVLVGLCPHPSRRSRWWNDRERAWGALQFLRSARQGLDHGVDEAAPGGWAGGLTPELEGGGGMYETRALAALEGSDQVPGWTGRFCFLDAPPQGDVPVTHVLRTWLSRHGPWPGALD